MQDLIRRIVWALVLPLLMGAPSNPEPVRTPKATAKWTIMIFMNAKNNLERAALRSFEEIARVGSSPEVNVVIALGRIKGHEDCDVCNRYPWDGVFYFHVLPHMEPARGNAKASAQHTDMGDPASLLELVEFSRRNYRAEHYALIIWGHGYGFSLLDVHREKFLDEQASRLVTCKLGSGVDSSGCSTSSDRVSGMKAVSRDPETNHVLYNRQIQETLKNALGNGPKLDVIGFDACLMGSIEIAYGMREIANYLIASEDLVPNCGWTYEEPLKKLTRSKGLMEPKEFATSFVRAYSSRFRKGPYYSTLSVVNLGKIEALASRISALAITLSEVESSELSNIERARNGCRVFGRDDGFKNPIDIEQFLRRLEGLERGDTTVARSVSSVLEILDSKELILDKFAIETDAFGLAIYFPADERAYAVNPDAYDGNAYDRTNCARPVETHAVEFVCDNEWSEFLPTYYAKLKPRSLSSKTVTGFKAADELTKFRSNVMSISKMEPVRPPAVRSAIAM